MPDREQALREMLAAFDVLWLRIILGFGCFARVYVTQVDKCTELPVRFWELSKKVSWLRVHLRRSQDNTRFTRKPEYVDVRTAWLTPAQVSMYSLSPQRAPRLESCKALRSRPGGAADIPNVLTILPVQSLLWNDGPSRSSQRRGPSIVKTRCEDVPWVLVF